ncbi:MAG TPA: NfeD family protein [Nocardioides sp.]|nr:NfeD family protein [Nocardioides sp.]
MHWFQDHQWEVWLGVAVLLMIAEMATLDLIMGMLAVGALAGMATVMLSGSYVVQAVVAAIVAIAMLGVVRPSLARRLHHGTEIALGNDRVIGLRGVVREPIAPLHVGRVAVDGEIWTASADVDIPAGTPVEVLEIRGATAHVRAVPGPGAEYPEYKEIR